MVETSSGDCPQKTITRTWTVSDNCGNVTEMSQVITIQGEGSGNYNLRTQADVDNFVLNAPSDGIVNNMIIGFTEILENSDIDDISGLSFLKGIEGDLIIEETMLSNLNGLQNIEYITGDLTITGVGFFSNLNGLKTVGGNLSIQGGQNSFNILESIGGDLSIRSNILLNCFTILKSIPGNFTIIGFSATDSTLDGFNNLTNIAGDFLIGQEGESLCVSNFSGFDKISEISGDFLIHTSNISSFASLSGLQTIGGKLSIINCPSLTSLNGFDDLQSVKHLVIEYNENLTDCSGLCTLFSGEDITGVLEINHNPTACNSQVNIEADCDSSEDGFNFSTQNQLNTFVSNNSHQSTIIGDITIGDNTPPFESSDITDISGLSFITTIVGNLYIGNNNSLESLNGIENIRSINGDVIIEKNDTLKTLRENNPTDIGFEKLEAIGGFLQISENKVLENLNGLEKLKSVKKNLIISSNANLSDCIGLCNILENNGVDGSIFIISNPSGCSNEPDVEASCISSSDEITIQSEQLRLLQNPVKDLLKIEQIENRKIVSIEIYNQFGQKIIESEFTEEIYVGKLTSGVYFAKVTLESGVGVVKFIKQ